MALNQDHERAPVLVGAGQIVQRDVDPREALDPIGLMVEASQRAAGDAGLGAPALASLDRVIVPSVLGASYSNAARLLAERLGASAADPLQPGVGGNGPQRQLNRAARDVAAGRADLVLLASGEALNTRQEARRAGVAVDWTGGGAPSPVDPEPPPTNDLENRHRLMVPPFIYPLAENARRAERGNDLEGHRRAVGAMLERLTEVAAHNPFAWFRTRRSADELTRPGPSNRMVAFPYTKYMNAMLRVDQAAAVIVTSVERARTLGVSADRMVHWLGGGDAVEAPWTLTERPSLAASPGMARAFADAFAESGLQPEDVHAFDLYSCFPSAIQLACDALDIGLDDPRPLSVTGGLPYAGGPGNGYVTHAVATLVKRLRSDPGAVGMATGLGWYFTKHSAGLYSTLPPLALPERGRPPPPPPAAPVAVAERPAGSGRVETYTVVHDRDGEPELGIVVGRLEDDRRFLALLDGDAAELAAFEADEGVGRKGRVRTEGDLGRFALV